ncbi:hypothetical protein [Vibrio bathopelagicus]|uniref:hypothetical protein n=1 Tax=Vibrio bathopelagicus TaxID=2777577 RepID=UPI0018643688|nr:hypothetical protein [Vibrio bathopelagicus]
MSGLESMSSIPTKSELQNVGLVLSIWLLALIVIIVVLSNFEILHPLSILSCNALVFIFFTAISEKCSKCAWVKWVALFFNMLLLVVSIVTLPSTGVLKAIEKFDGPKTIWTEKL